MFIFTPHTCIYQNVLIININLQSYDSHPYDMGWRDFTKTDSARIVILTSIRQRYKKCNVFYHWIYRYPATDAESSDYEKLVPGYKNNVPIDSHQKSYIFL